MKGKRFFSGMILVSCILFSSSAFSVDLVVKRANIPIVIDGLAEDSAWALVEGNLVENDFVGTVDDPYDSEGHFKMLWDSTYLYFLCDVFDEQLFEDSEGANEHDESFDLFFDASLSGGDLPDDDDWLLTLEWSSTGTCLKSGIKGTIFPELDTTGIIARCSETLDGYLIEAAIPLENLELMPGYSFGFDLRINDDDDGSSRDTQIAWHCTDVNQWSNPSTLAEIELKNEPIIDAIFDIPVLPSTFSLEQNYPNPFNPNTRICYTLPTNSRVRLSVYDITGKKVAVLVDGIQTQGKHTVTFSAIGLSSGVYFYRLYAGKEEMMKRMILVK
jgi:hypothetical protein